RQDFFGFFGEESRPIQLSSDPATLTVLPLPAEGRPDDFSGAVGTFAFAVTAQPHELAVGDPGTVESVVQGAGALGGISPPPSPASDAFRVYPVQTKPPAKGENGRTFEQVVIPLRDGTIALPRLRFSFFDPTARAYRSLEAAPVSLAVRPSAQAKTAPQIVGAAPAPATAPEAAKTLGRDLVFIKDAPGELTPVGARRYRSVAFWL